MKKRKLKLRPSKVGLLAERALKKAVANVIKVHREKKLPLVVWKNGRVVKIAAKNL